MTGSMATEEEVKDQHHHSSISSFLHGLASWAKSTSKCSIPELLERLDDSNLSTVQSKACKALAMHAKESPEKLQEIKQAGAVEAIEALRVRTQHNSVRVAALDALVALQSKAAVLPLVQLLEQEDDAAAPKQHSDVKNWACDSLHDLLKHKGSLQRTAIDAGAVPALAKLERRCTTKELLHLLGPADSHHVRNSGSRVSRGYSSTLDIPDAFPEAAEDEEAAAAQEAKQQPASSGAVA